MREACSDASEAENRGPWDLPQPVPRAHHTLLIEHASLVRGTVGADSVPIPEFAVHYDPFF